MDKLLTLKECADLLQVSVPTIYRRIADGSLPKPVKLGNLTRVRESELLSAVGALGAKSAEVSKLDDLGSRLDAVYHALKNDRAYAASVVLEAKEAIQSLKRNQS